MNQSGNRTETIKNVILVVLLLSTILLLYLNWTTNESFDLSRILPFSDAEEPVSGEDAIVPEEAYFSNSDGSFALAEDPQSAYRYALKLMKSRSEKEYYGVEAFDESLYNQMRDEFETVMFRYSYKIPFEDFCNHFGIVYHPEMSAISEIDSFGFSEADTYSIFVSDCSEGLYYRIVYADDTYLAGELEKYFTDGIICYKSSDILGGSSAALLPIEVESDLLESGFREESIYGSDEEIDASAESIFGETFDFVRRITDGFGNTTFMYGYGEKTFTVSADGYLEYKCENSGDNAGFFEDVQTALAFAEKCGGSGSYILVSAESEGSGNKHVRKLEFEQTLGGKKVAAEEAAISVEVCGGQVTKFTRKTAELAEVRKSAEKMTAISGSEAIAANYNHIYNILSGNIMAGSSDKAFGYVAEELAGMESGYFRSEMDESCIPCWVFTAKDGTRFIFDLYEGTPLAFIR